MDRQRLLSRITTVMLVFLLGLMVHPTVSAQTVVKRASCAEADAITAFNNPIYFHENQTSTTQIVTMQVIRDGCRPRGSDGRFALWVVSPGGAGSSKFLPRFGRFTASMSRAVLPGYRVFIRYSTDARPGGTFDYTYSID